MEVIVSPDGYCYVEATDCEFFQKVMDLFWKGELIDKDTGDIIMSIHLITA